MPYSQQLKSGSWECRMTTMRIYLYSPSSSMELSTHTHDGVFQARHSANNPLLTIICVPRHSLAPQMSCPKNCGCTRNPFYVCTTVASASSRVCRTPVWGLSHIERLQLFRSLLLSSQIDRGSPHWVFFSPLSFASWSTMSSSFDPNTCGKGVKHWCIEWV